MHNLVPLRRFTLRKMLVVLLKADFYFCLCTEFYTFVLQVQTHPIFPSFSQSNLIFGKLRYLLKF